MIKKEILDDQFVEESEESVDLTWALCLEIGIKIGFVLFIAILIPLGGVKLLLILERIFDLPPYLS